MPLKTGERNAQIYEAREAGKTFVDIGKEHGIGGGYASHIYKVQKRMLRQFFHRPLVIRRFTSQEKKEITEERELRYQMQMEVFELIEKMHKQYHDAGMPVNYHCAMRTAKEKVQKDYYNRY